MTGCHKEMEGWWRNDEGFIRNVIKIWNNVEMPRFTSCNTCTVLIKEFNFHHKYLILTLVHRCYLSTDVASRVAYIPICSEIIFSANETLCRNRNILSCTYCHGHVSVYASSYGPFCGRWRCTRVRPVVYTVLLATVQWRCPLVRDT